MMNFNIQLFADAQTNTTGTMSVEMKTFYEKRLIDQAEPRLVHAQFADYYPVPQNGGKTIEFRKYDSLPKASRWARVMAATSGRTEAAAPGRRPFSSGRAARCCTRSTTPCSTVCAVVRRASS